MLPIKYILIIHLFVIVLSVVHKRKSFNHTTVRKFRDVRKLLLPQLPAYRETTSYIFSYQFAITLLAYVNI